MTRIEPAARRIVVGSRKALETSRARVRQVAWLAGEAPKQSVPARVRVRYRHAGALAQVEPTANGEAIVHFDEPVAAVSPGQAAVFYDAEDGNEVLGGGWLARGAV